MCPRCLVCARYDKPFDRHDWYVNRCGREVRYIIDYYGATNAHGFHIDARPVLSLGGLIDRGRVMANRFWKRFGPQQAPTTAAPSAIGIGASPFRGPPEVGTPASKPASSKPS